METKKVEIVNGEYFIDIDISVSEWKDILLNKNVTTENYWSTLLKFYNEPEHKSTCKLLGEKYAISVKSINVVYLSAPTRPVYI